MRSKIEMKHALLIACTLLVFHAAAQYQPHPVNPDKFLDSLTAVEIGKEFPQFTAQGLNNLHISSSDLNGKVVFISFWFADCTPCIREIAGLNRLYDSVKSRSDVLFLSFTNDTREKSREAVKRFGIKFPVLNFSDEECYRLNFNSGFPTNFVLNRKGIINWAAHGAPPDGKVAAQHIFETGLAQMIKVL